MHNRIFQALRQSLHLATMLAVLAFIQPVEPVTAAPLLQEQQNAVAMARAGNTSSALTLLEKLYLQDPENIGLRNDYAVIAAWNGNDALCVKLLAPADPAGLPANVLAVYAKSLRNLGDWNRSLATYDRLILLQPKQLDGYIGRIMVLADSDQFEDAERALNNIPQHFAADPRYSTELLLTRGYVAERQGHFTAALGYYNKGLRAEPDNRALRKQRVFMASALGAGDIALREAQSEPGLFDSEQLTRFQLEALALQIRWAGLPRPAGAASSAESAVAGYEVLTPLSESNIRHRQYDYIIALTEARRMVEAVAQFEQLRAEVGVENIPYYVLSSAGRAYLYLEQSQQALDCFLAAQENLPENATRDARFNVEMGLFYALTDEQQFDAASALINEMKAQETAWIEPPAKEWLPNQRYAVSQEAAAMALAYRDEYDEALEQLDQLIAIAPANSNLRMSRAAVVRWRGLYRASKSDLNKVNMPSAQFSKNISAAHLALDTQNFEEAHDLLRNVSATEPEAKAVVDLEQRWRSHQRSQLFVDAYAGESDGAELGNRSYTVDTRYYSEPLDYHYRLMVHDIFRYVKFDDGPVRDHRLGAGLEYREQYWTVTSEVNQGLDDNDDIGASLGANWQPTDHWYLAAQASYNSSSVPMQAVESDITANDLSLSARYRSNESRETSVFLGTMDFEDGNLREWLGTSYSQRVLNLPHHKLRASASAYFSRNDSDDAPYFNPSSDREVTVGLEHEWRIFRDYDRSLVQRAGIYAGIYDQASYGADSLWRFRIGHDWEISDRLSFSYGFDIARRPYDGKQEEEKSIFISLGCRL